MSRTLMLSECSLRELSSSRFSWVSREGSCVRMRMRGATRARGTDSVGAALTGAASLDRLECVFSMMRSKSVGQPLVGLTSLGQEARTLGQIPPACILYR